MSQKIVPLHPCVICGSTQSWLLQEAEPPYRVVECQDCSLAYVDPIPPRDLLSRHYGEDYYAEWISAQKKRRDALWRRRIDELLQYRNGGRLLDVGCGDGTFLSLGKKAGFEAFGTEVSQYGAQRTRELYGIPVIVGELQEADFSPEFFDVVTLYHVLEHVADPAAYMAEVYRIVKPGGLVVVACPNVESHIFNFFYRLFKGRDYHLFSVTDKELHLYHFSVKTLWRLLRRQEFQVLSIGLDDPSVDPRKETVEILARLLYRILGKNWSMAMKAFAVK